MIKLLVFLTALLTFPVSGSSAQDYPSQRAARLGYEKFADFYVILAPLWHEAFPSKDYGTLMAAAPLLDSAVTAIHEMKYSSRYERKFEGYKAKRHELLSLVVEYEKAAKEKDSARVYYIFPQIQAAFESTAVFLLPLPYPAFDRALTEVSRFTAALPAVKDVNERAKACQSITEMIRLISPVDAPAELKDRDLSGMVPKELAYFDTLSVRMRRALDKGEISKFEQLTKELNTRFQNFRRIYLE